MKLFKVFFALFLLTSFSAFSQEKVKTQKGKVTGKVFFNYHYNGTKDAKQTDAYELTRAYLGYKYKYNDQFSAKILLDAGKNSAGSAYTIFIKNAKLDYKANEWLTLTAGILGMKQFKVQEDFWGYRYLYKSLEDEYKFGSSADVGFMTQMKVSDKIHLDLLVVNGEGYRQLQDQSGYNRYGINLIYNPVKNLTLKAYYDTTKGEDVDDPLKTTTMSNNALFIGYRINEHLRIAAEYNLMKDAIAYNKPAEGKDLKGISFYSTYLINPKWNLFGRYDSVSSNTIENEGNPWNYSENGKIIIGGFEYKPVKGVNTSVNYRFFNFDDSTINDASFIYLNLEFYF